MSYFQVQYRDFSGNAVVRYWKLGSVAAARTKARDQGNCREVTDVIVISEEHYQTASKGQRCQQQSLRVDRRGPPKRIRRKAAK